MKILIIGDSFVEGVDAEGKYGWTQRFRDNYQNYIITTSGIGGDNIEKIINRLSNFRDKYDFVILEVGVNDSRYRPSKKGNEIKETNFINGLINFTKYFRELNSEVKIYFLGLTQVNEKHTDPYKEDKHYLNKNIKKYDRLIQEISIKENVTYIKLPTLLDSDDLLSDGIHPSTKGHNLLYENIVSRIEVRK